MILSETANLLMLAGTNLETIKRNNFSVPTDNLKNDGTIKKINETIKNEDRVNVRAIIDLYL